MLSKGGMARCLFLPNKISVIFPFEKAYYPQDSCGIGKKMVKVNLQPYS